MLPGIIALMLLATPAYSTTFREHKELENFEKVTAPQEDTQWCWAACVAMVLSSRGAHISQEEIVRQIKGNVVNEPGSFDEIRKSLTLKNGDNDIVLRSDVANPFGDLDVVEKIDRGEPIIAAVARSAGESAHHVVIIYGYKIDTDNKIWLEIFDPAPDGGARTFRYGEDFFWQKTVLVTFPEELPDNQIDPKAKVRLVRDEFDPGQIQWTTTYPNRNVSYDIGYSNLDPDRPIMFKLVVRTGTIPRNGDKSDWVPHESKEISVELPPLGHTNLTGSLDWFGATPARMPRFEEIVTMCRFVGAAPPPVSNGVGAFAKFCGFSFGEKEAEVIKLLGKPESRNTDGDEASFDYYDDGLTVSFFRKTKRIHSISIRSMDAVSNLRRQGINDRKLSYFYDSRSHILELLGSPYEKGRDLKYKIRLEQVRVYVLLSFDNETEPKCDAMLVIWFYPDDE